MFDMFDDLFLESGFDDSGVTLTELESGFIWADCQVESTMERDPFEFMTEAMYATVINANRLNYAILQEKYDYLVENGVEMVSEAVSVEGIKEFFKKAVQKIKDFFEAAVAKMIELQAKFRMLFEKGKKRAELGMPKLTLKVPNYTPADVAKIVQISFSDIVANDYEMPSIDQIEKKGEKAPDFKEELNILKEYGKSVKDVKKAKNDALKTLRKLEKEAIKLCSDKYERTHQRTDYAQAVNGVNKLSRDLVKLIMKRVNASAKVINAAFKEGKDDYKKMKKAEKDADKAKNESALFDFI